MIRVATGSGAPSSRGETWGDSKVPTPPLDRCPTEARHRRQPPSSARISGAEKRVGRGIRCYRMHRMSILRFCAKSHGSSARRFFEALLVKRTHKKVKPKVQ